MLYPARFVLQSVASVLQSQPMERASVFTLDQVASFTAGELPLQERQRLWAENRFREFVLRFASRDRLRELLSVDAKSFDCRSNAVAR